MINYYSLGVGSVVCASEWLLENAKRHNSVEFPTATNQILGDSQKCTTRREGTIANIIAIFVYQARMRFHIANLPYIPQWVSFSANTSYMQPIIIMSIRFKTVPVRIAIIPENCFSSLTFQGIWARWIDTSTLYRMQARINMNTIPIYNNTSIYQYQNECMLYSY